MESGQLSLRECRRPALLVVDAMRGFTDPACPLGIDCAEVIRAIGRLLARFREFGWPVFFTTVSYDDDSQARVFRRKLPALEWLQTGSPWVALDARLSPRADEPVLRKFWASGFFGSDLHERLAAEQVDGLVVAGLSTSGCVRATALDGLQHDYPVFVPREACGDRDADAHERSLRDLSIKYAEVVCVDAALAQLAGEAFA